MRTDPPARARTWFASAATGLPVLVAAATVNGQCDAAAAATGAAAVSSVCLPRARQVESVGGANQRQPVRPRPSSSASSDDDVVEEEEE